jgi:sulfur carrier protein
MAQQIHVTVNGEDRALPAPCSVGALLDALGVPRVKVAVERNGAVLRRAQHDEIQVGDGDVLEIVTLVGGG